MFDIRAITSNISSIINDYDGKLNVLIIGDESNIKIIDDNSVEDLNFFQIGNYQGSNYTGDIKSNVFWNNLFDDFNAMNKTFDIIVFNNYSLSIDFDEKLLKKISLIFYNLLEDKGLIIYSKNINLDLRESKIKTFTDSKFNVNVYFTKNNISEWENNIDLSTDFNDFLIKTLNRLKIEID